jgi:2-keto-4-pentenoate hydratase/2-oxohepta-3-ene-1,7-dioic acid hydratase in catechol pathway
MRYARFFVENDAVAHHGSVEGETVVDLGPAPPTFEFPSPGATGPRLPLSDVRLTAPIARPPKFLAIGLNYADHANESGMARPDFPVFFNKQSTCVVGPGEAVHVPRASAVVDYEGELGIVIGRRCRHVSAADAVGVVAGYTIVNDVTVRDWQFKAPTWTLGKSFDTHGPIGPWIVTTDELPDPHSLQLRTFVNGELLQDANTKEMLFNCWEQIETLSTACTLEPGDVIATGTPAGIGFTRQPPVLLKPGDTVRVEIEGIGILENPVIAEPDDTAVR